MKRARSPENAQRRVARNLVLFTVPLALILLLSVLLIWEIVRDNMAEATRARWPWRLALLDQQSLGHMLALTGGVAFARAQYARSVRPQIGWSGMPMPNTYGMSGDEVWEVTVHNGGTRSATIECAEYAIEWKGQPTGGWLSSQEASRALAQGPIERALPTQPEGPLPPAQPAVENASGKSTAATSAGWKPVNGKDFYLNTIGYGGQLGTFVVGRFSHRIVDELADLHLRIRVVDAAGDHHERVLNCLIGAENEMRAAAEEMPPPRAVFPARAGSLSLKKGRASKPRRAPVPAPRRRRPTARGIRGAQAEPPGPEGMC
ncbi:hypothetical protein [Streptomyces sp. WM6378]|uniref:hypothetical protein n=1 Tax=Streptomyces sp. WM6378 TaxID=1415557 RepID=UPI0006AF8002|nr:hypothetical protein [Streptomyces sp. WM6378]KOU47750.1 hypothetical protein ADK54_12720 [Streptomyces sp. WM6378]